MFDKSNLIKSFAAALLGTALIAAPALAQKTDASGARIGGSVGAAAPAPSAGGAPPAGSIGGSRANATIAAPHVNGSNYAYNGSGHHHNGHHHHHGAGFGFGFYGGPYAYDNDWAYQPDCTLRHVRIYRHHHRYWVWRRYCD
ncbi:MAG TPA: hypothetical protein VFW22_14140 [Pseudolabrys sp.]|nr:hypothetical protein [Pseudolabrys sp.]